MVRWLLLGFAVLWASAASAQEKAGVREGFDVAQIRGQKIVLFRPDIEVGEQSTGGLREPRAEWTETARQLMDAELRTAQGRFSNELVTMPDLVGQDAALVAEYQALFDTVSSSIIEYQFFPGNRLPTRKRGSFDWTLGEGTRRLAELSGARYALFITTTDFYGSTGRKMLQIAAALAHVSVTSGIHKGAAGLVDLQTGNILWLNADLQMGGDVREADGMQKRVQQLLEDFPGSTPAEEA
jgi:hypothetical protein